MTRNGAMLAVASCGVPFSAMVLKPLIGGALPPLPSSSRGSPIAGAAKSTLRSIDAATTATILVLRD